MLALHRTVLALAQVQVRLLLHLLTRLAHSCLVLHLLVVVVHVLLVRRVGRVVVLVWLVLVVVVGVLVVVGLVPLVLPPLLLLLPLCCDAQNASLNLRVDPPSGPVQLSSELNSCLGPARPGGVRTKRSSPAIRNGLAVLTDNMSPAPAAGIYLRSALRDQRQVTRSKLARGSGAGAGPVPGLGGRSGLVGGVPDLAAACLGIPCSLVMPPGRHQFAPQSRGWARVCGTQQPGVSVLKGGARTCSLP